MHRGREGVGMKCDNKLKLDQTYYVYSYDVRRFTNSSNSIANGQAPLIVFAAVHEFPKPDWANEQDEDTLFIHWRPSRLQSAFVRIMVTLR